MAGRVRVGTGDGARSNRKAGDLVEASVAVDVETPLPYVSRGGEKLAGALDAFAVDPAGLVCLDVGASTGGFTDLLLQRGAARVHAIDVGRGQLAEALRRDPRVVSRERTNARGLTPALLGESVALAVIDVSFISLRLVLPPTAACLAPGGRVVALVKPQFEAGRGRAPGGVVRDPAVHREVLGAALDARSRRRAGPAGPRRLAAARSGREPRVLPPRGCCAPMKRNPSNWAARIADLVPG